MKHWRALGVSVLLVGGLATPSVVAARGGGGGGFHGGGGGFQGGGGGAYRFSAPPAEAPPVEAAPRIDAAPVERAAPLERADPVPERSAAGGGSMGGGGLTDRPVDRSLDQGYSGSHHLYGAGTRSSWTGHNISSDQFKRFNQGGWNDNRIGGNLGGNRFNRQVNIDQNFYNRNYGEWNSDWGDDGYWGSRPWGYGWYNWSPDTWGWWGDSSAGWGLAALAGAEVITDLVNTASEQQSPVIDVPDSDYQLNYATVDSVGTGGADFSYAFAGSPPVKGAANCQQGLLDGQVPSTAAQAQLLNAACQVAYGPDPKGTPLPESLSGRLPGWLRDLLVMALGGGIAVAGWQLVARRRTPFARADDHHAPVTSS